MSISFSDFEVVIANRNHVGKCQFFPTVILGGIAYVELACPRVKRSSADMVLIADFPICNPSRQPKLSAHNNEGVSYEQAFIACHYRCGCDCDRHLRVRAVFSNVSRIPRRRRLQRRRRRTTRPDPRRPVLRQIPPSLRHRRGRLLEASRPIPARGPTPARRRPRTLRPTRLRPTSRLARPRPRPTRRRPILLRTRTTRRRAPTRRPQAPTRRSRRRVAVRPTRPSSLAIGRTRPIVRQTPTLTRR